MLFVKDLLFLDGALATLAPDVDLFAEITDVADLLRDPLRRAHRRPRSASTRGSQAVDLDGLKASIGVTTDVQTLTYRDLQARREIIRKRMEEHHRGGRRRRRGR